MTEDEKVRMCYDKMRATIADEEAFKSAAADYAAASLREWHERHRKQRCCNNVCDWNLTLTMTKSNRYGKQN